MRRGLSYFTYSALAIFLIFCFQTISAQAAGGKELKEQWYTTKDYPVLPGCRDWRLHDFTEMVDILNPPEDLLESFTSGELAELLLRYPYLINLIGGYDDVSMFFDFMGQCLIYEELFRREDGVRELLNAFQKNQIDLEMLNEKPVSVYGGESGTLADLFVCRYMRFYWNSISEEDKRYYCEIAEEKKQSYMELKEDDPKDYLCEELLFHDAVVMIQTETEISTQIVIDPNYQGTMITESKNGYKGVYRAKYSDMMTYYRGVSYKVFRRY